MKREIQKREIHNEEFLPILDVIDPVGYHAEPAICLQSVSVHRSGTEVLHDIDLCVDEGVFLGIIGPNGGGKTTLLNVLLGRIRPSSGRVEVFGRKPSSRRLRYQVGYVPQYQPIPQNFPATAYDVVLMGAYGVSGKFFPVKRQYKELASQLLYQVRLDHVMHKPIGHLSGGQQQRVFIARALITRPRLLLLDEPLRGVDAAGQSQFFDLLINLKREYDLTVVMVSHDIHLLSKFSEQIACLNQTIHWHDRSELMNHEVISHTYRCELEAIFTQQFDEQEEKPFNSPCDASHHHHLDLPRL